MLKKFGKGLLTCILIIIAGGLNIIEIGIEIIYQIVYSIKRGYGYMMAKFLKIIPPIVCKDKILLKTKK